MILQLDCFWMDFLEVMCVPVIVAVPDQGRALHGPLENINLFTARVDVVSILPMKNRSRLDCATANQ